MSIDGEGKIRGTVGGGKGELEVIGKGREAIENGHAALVHLEMWATEGTDPGMVCGGSTDILVESLLPERDTGWIDAVVRATGENRSVRLVRRLREEGSIESRPLAVVDSEGGSIWTADDTAVPSLPRQGGAHGYHFFGEEKKGGPFLVEEIRPYERLIIIGAGHVGAALCEIGAFLRFDVTMADERPGVAVPERFPRASRLFTGDVARFVSEIDETGRCYFALLGHSYVSDVNALRVLLDRETRYVGMIGSRRRVATVRRVLEMEGRRPEEMACIFGPIGIEIGAQSPEEIAVSIAAEIVAVRNGMENPPSSISLKGEV